MRRSFFAIAGASLAACTPVPAPEEVTMVDLAAVPDAPAADATALRASFDAGASVEAAVQVYLDRIEALDGAGPQIQSVLTLNPNALVEAQALDALPPGERGRLHGLPVLIKDNVETKEMPTTAGSLALADNDTGRDSPLVARLRAEGAIVLGKTNLSEWANFRSNSSISGWSGVGGQTKNPHSLDRSPCGSSAGSGAAAAAMLAPLTIGTETNGSILCPAAMNGVVGFKPTVGLVPRTHIVPISFSQDTAGPMTRSVRDAALMLTAMAGSDPADPATVEADARKQDYTAALNADLSGVRIGVLRFAQGEMAEIVGTFDEALDALQAAGAVLVEIDTFETPDGFWGDALTVLEVEFKATLNDYLAVSAPGVAVRSLSDLIAFNEENAARELALFDQSLLISSEARGGLDDPEYLEALATVRQATRADGIDALLSQNNVDVLVAPSRPPAFFYDAVFTDQYPSVGIGAGWMAAIAGYPSMTVPMGSYRGLPLGIDIMGPEWGDADVLGVGYAYEQKSQKIMMPTFAAGPFDVPATSAAMRPFAGGE